MGQGREITIRRGAVPSGQQKCRMVDPAHQTSPGQVGPPAGAAAGAVKIEPFPAPALRTGSRPGIAHRRQIIKPQEAMQIGIKLRIGNRQGPDRGLLRLDREARELELPGDQLPPARETAHDPRFRGCYKAGLTRALRRKPGVQTLDQPPARHVRGPRHPVPCRFICLPADRPGASPSIRGSRPGRTIRAWAAQVISKGFQSGLRMAAMKNPSIPPISDQ